jgi:hypothetical protein
VVESKVKGLSLADRNCPSAGVDRGGTAQRADHGLYARREEVSLRSRAGCVPILGVIISQPGLRFDGVDDSFAGSVSAQ